MQFYSSGFTKAIHIMTLFLKVQKVLLYIIFVLSVLLLINAIVEQYAMLVVMVFTATTFLAGYCITIIKDKDDE